MSLLFATPTANLLISLLTALRLMAAFHAKLALVNLLDPSCYREEPVPIRRNINLTC